MGMRIGIVTYYGKEIGGTFFYTLKYVRALIENNNKYSLGHQIFFLGPIDDYCQEFQAMEIIDQLKLIDMPRPYAPGLFQKVFGKLHRSSPRFLRRLILYFYEKFEVRRQYRRSIKVAKKLQLDLVVATAPDALPLFINANYDIIIHDVYFYEHFFETESNMIKQFVSGGDYLRAKITESLAQGSRRVLTESYLSRSQIASLYNVRMRDIIVVPTGPADFESRDITLPDQARKLEKYIFYPGHVHVLKNQIRLFESVAILRERGLTIHIVLTGHAEDMNDQHKRIVKELDIKSQVHFLGHVTNAEMTALYKNAYCVCMASYIGPTNMPIWEAMRIGCPVVASNIGDQRWQVGEEGLLFDPDNASALADLLERLWTDSEFWKYEGERLQKRYQIFEFDCWDQKVAGAVFDNKSPVY